MKVRKVPHFFCCFIWKCQKNVLSLWCKNKLNIANIKTPTQMTEV